MFWLLFFAAAVDVVVAVGVAGVVVATVRRMASLHGTCETIPVSRIPQTMPGRKHRKTKNIEAYRIIRDLLPATSMSLMPLQ